MIAKFSVQSMRPAGSACRSQAFENRDTRETRSSQIWRQEIVGMLEANLTNLDALAHGFVPSRVQRLSGF